nr:unnamed protein product [Callosobruchus chinensis]
MRYIWSKFTNLFSHFTKSARENEERKISKYDVYCEQIYKVLSWENPKHTLTVFLVSIIVQLRIKIFSVIFFGLLIAFVLDAYYDIKDLTKNDYKDHSAELRKFFCTIFDAMLYIKAIPNSISGYMLIYLTILGIFFIPLWFKCLPEEHVCTLKVIFASLVNSKDNDDADSQLTDKTAESASNSLISGLGQMPSYLDVSEIQTEIEEEDLIPHTNPHSAISYTPGELSSDSDSDPRDIHFKAAHFNGDSSSEEEKLMSRDLSFMAIGDSSVDGADMNEQGGALGLGKVLGSIVANARSASHIERTSSTSDSDFEIVNTEDVKD